MAFAGGGRVMLIKCIHRAAMLSALVILAVPAWAQRGQGLGRQRAIAQGTCLIDAVPKQELDSTEAAGMAYMREEEKLARDVYAKIVCQVGRAHFRQYHRKRTEAFR
jgi:hypothetical protein